MKITYNKTNRISRVMLCMVAASMVSLSAHAVTGVIVDKLGQPVSSAQVSILGTDVKVLTDEEGKFDLTTPSGSKLFVTAPGYIAIEYSVESLRREKDRDNVVIVLMQDYRFGIHGLYRRDKPHYRFNHYPGPCRQDGRT